MSYRDDLEAAAQRADSLARENERLRQEAADLRQQLATSKAAAEERRDAESTLEALADSGGRVLSDHDAKQQQAHRDAAARSTGDELRRFGKICSPLSVGVVSGALWWFAALPLAALALFAVAYLVGELLEAGRFATAGGVMAFAAILVVALCVAAAPFRRASVRRELRWLASLPFPVQGYVRAATENYMSPTGLVVSIQFAREAPAAETFSKLAAGLYPRKVHYLVATSQGAEARFNLPPFVNPRRSFHRAVDALLLPLHHGHPIAEVRVDPHPGYDRR